MLSIETNKKNSKKDPEWVYLIVGGKMFRATAKIGNKNRSVQLIIDAEKEDVTVVRESAMKKANT